MLRQSSANLEYGRRVKFFQDGLTIDFPCDNLDVAPMYQAKLSSDWAWGLGPGAGIGEWGNGKWRVPHVSESDPDPGQQGGLRQQVHQQPVFLGLSLGTLMKEKDQDPISVQEIVVEAARAVKFEETR